MSALDLREMRDSIRAVPPTLHAIGPGNQIVPQIAVRST
jgi:hypothetical protein